MTPSEFIKEKKVGNLDHIAKEALCDPATINRWYYNKHRRLDLILKGLLYEEAVKTKEDLDSGRVGLVPPKQYEIMKKIINERERE